MDVYNPCDEHYVSKIERALSTWKDLWLRHPRAKQSMTHLDDPLLNDCLSLLGSAYYHLYAGEELVTLKRIAKDTHHVSSLPAYKDRSDSHKVIKYAANSWLVRSKLGLKYLSKTKGLELGAQALFNSYETGESTVLLKLALTITALILAWWLHLHKDGVGGVRLTSADQDLDSIRKVFAEIRAELAEQDMDDGNCSSTQLDAIGFYTHLLSGWTWRGSSALGDRLHVLRQRLQSLAGRAGWPDGVPAGSDM